MLSFFPRDDLDGIGDLIGSVSEGFFLPTSAWFVQKRSSYSMQMASGPMVAKSSNLTAFSVKLPYNPFKSR